jgi:hypothetical protein
MLSGNKNTALEYNIRLVFQFENPQFLRFLEFESDGTTVTSRTSHFQYFYYEHDSEAIRFQACTREVPGRYFSVRLLCILTYDVGFLSFFYRTPG